MKSVMISFDQASYEKVDRLLERLHAIDTESEMLGLRAFVWNVEKTI